jgi:hypothetical protein
MTRAEKSAAKKLDAEIERLYRQNCAGIQISVWDIDKVFQVARQAHAQGKDVKTTIIEFVESIRKN